MKSLASAVVLVVALSGCFDFYGHCGYQLEAVSWSDAGFGMLLQESVGWNVTVEPASRGLAHTQAEIASWDATIQSASIEVQADQRLQMDRLGVLALWNVPDPLPEGMHQAVADALLQVTDGSEAEVANWTNALFSHPNYLDYGRFDGHSEVPERAVYYEYALDKERIQLDRVLEGNVPEKPAYSIDSGGWSVQLEFPRVTAVQGPMEFVAGLGGNNEFRSVLWFDSGTNEQAMRDFAAAYESLGVGPVPSDAGAYGSIC